MRTFKVATYYDPEDRRGKVLRASHIRAYTYWYNPGWPGCRVYEVEARSGAEAKRIAIQMRLEHERAGLESA